jgi:TnsA endonuclease N terminal
MHFQVLPGRLIPPKSRGLTGRLTLRDATQVCFESGLERDLIILLDFERSGRLIKTQPFTLTWEGDGRKRIYTPDVFVQYADSEKRPIQIIEVKPSDVFEKERARLEPKYEEVQVFCKTQGWEFLVKTEREIRLDAYLNNATFFRRYLRDRPDGAIAQIICNQLKKTRCLTPTQVLDQCSPVESMRPKFLFELWTLIAQKFVLMDFTQALNQDKTQLKVSPNLDFSVFFDLDIADAVQ